MSIQFLRQPDGIISYEFHDAHPGQDQAPLVICVPGMGDLRQQYRFLAPVLAEAGWRVVTMDIRGHGRSSVDWPNYRVGAIGRDLVALIQELDAGPAALIGNSMAAGAAVWAAAEAPDLVSGLVLLGPAVRGKMTRPMRLFLAALFARPWGPYAWQRYYQTLYPTRKPADFTEYSIFLRANLKEKGRMEALYAMMAADKADSESHLARVSAPVQVIMGTKDPDFKDPEAEARWVASSLKGSLNMIQGAGHYPHVEMPEITAPLVMAFLRTLRNKQQETKRENYVA